ncbi:hypothetical protein [Photobacterium satsumensis]|uniref:hypothetical protein n=1 Tax=Photobacterium satsumensis TaxID=2910239 RepID=UPI003D0BFA21
MYKVVAYLGLGILVGCSSITEIQNESITDITGSWECSGLGDKSIQLSYRDRIDYIEDGSFDKLSKMNFKLPSHAELYDVTIASKGTWNLKNGSVNEEMSNYSVEVGDDFPEMYVEQLKSNIKLPEKAKWKLTPVSEQVISKTSNFGQKLTCKKVLL